MGRANSPSEHVDGGPYRTPPRGLHVSSLEFRELFDGTRVPRRVVERVTDEVMAQMMRDKYIETSNHTMAQWEKWLPSIQDADPALEPEIQSQYMSGVISRERLLALLDENDYEIARQDIKQRAGFLKPYPPCLATFSAPRGLCKVHVEEGKVTGFYTILTDADEVKTQMTTELGWQEGMVYDRSNLPMSSRDGNSIEWKEIQKDYVAEVLNAIADGQVALPGDLYVHDTTNDGLPARDSGKGKALKVAAYRELKNKYTITMLFEICGINGQRISRSIPNQWSLSVNQRMGAHEVGTKHEVIHRPDGISIDVGWRLFVSDVKEVQNPT